MSRSDGSTWIVGSGGLLGRALKRDAEVEAKVHRHDPIDWTSDDATSVVKQLAADFAQSVENWSAVWCAGAGVIGTDAAALARETEILSAALDGLATARTPGTFMLASSAGGLYGGATAIPITESTAACPISPYGWNKLEQERRVREWATSTSSRGVIARISNLYGPGQRLDKPQGLVTQICRSTITRRPISIYVSLDTLRDYLFVEDCSTIMLDMLDRSDRLAFGETVYKIVATGHSISIGSLLGEARRVLGRPPNIIMTRSHQMQQQGSTLAFRSEVWREIDDRSLTPLPVGIERTAAELRHLISSGQAA